MENEAALIRQQMLETRTSLTEKLENLEEQVTTKVKDTTESVVETVETVKDAVESTVQNVSDTVHSTVETVKDTFDLSHQMEQRPWMMFGGAVLLGFLGGKLLDRLGPPSTNGNGFVPTSYPTPAREPAPAYQTSPTPAGPGVGSKMLEAMKPALSKLGGLAIGVTTGVIGEMIRDAAPQQMHPQLDEVVNDITLALGGTPFHFDHSRDAVTRHSDGLSAGSRQLP
jgi:ElaB/YqjD/DUF883 family membrane-anchored ribosome-binding protein